MEWVLGNVKIHCIETLSLFFPSLILQSFRVLSSSSDSLVCLAKSHSCSSALFMADIIFLERNSNSSCKRLCAKQNEITGSTRSKESYNSCSHSGLFYRESLSPPVYSIRCMWKQDAFVIAGTILVTRSPENSFSTSCTPSNSYNVCWPLTTKCLLPLPAPLVFPVRSTYSWESLSLLYLKFWQFPQVYSRRVALLNEPGEAEDRIHFTAWSPLCLINMYEASYCGRYEDYKNKWHMVLIV